MVASITESLAGRPGYTAHEETEADLEVTGIDAHGHRRDAGHEAGPLLGVDETPVAVEQLDAVDAGGDAVRSARERHVARLEVGKREGLLVAVDIGGLETRVATKAMVREDPPTSGGAPTSGEGRCAGEPPKEEPPPQSRIWTPGS